MSGSAAGWSLRSPAGDAGSDSTRGPPLSAEVPRVAAANTQDAAVVLDRDHTDGGDTDHFGLDAPGGSPAFQHGFPTTDEGYVRGRRGQIAAVSVLVGTVVASLNKPWLTWPVLAIASGVFVWSWTFGRRRTRRRA